MIEELTQEDRQRIEGKLQITEDYINARQKYKDATEIKDSIEKTITFLQKQLQHTEKDRYKALDNLLPFEDKYLRALGFDSKNYVQWEKARTELREGKQLKKQN